MKITKQLLEKMQGDAFDKAQLVAYKTLKLNPRAFAAIYAYTYGGKKTVLNKPLLKYNQKEVQDFIDGFSKGKEAIKATVDVIYRAQLDSYEDSLRERGLIEEVEKDDEYYIKAGLLGTDEVKNENLKIVSSHKFKLKEKKRGDNIA